MRYTRGRLPNLNNVALFVILLFHVSGCIGMFTAHRQWFIAHTPLNLLIAFVLLVATQRKKNAAFFIFMVLAFSVGMGVEMVGIHTGYLFGDYQYGDVLGPGIHGVPLLIGVNWFVIMYCSGITITLLHKRLYRNMQQRVPPQGLMIAAFLFDAALLATFFDWVMEPVAVQLGFWTWLGNQGIPMYNYVCWFMVSALLLLAFRLLRFDKENHLAVHLLVVQLLFFGVLRTFL